MEKKDKYGYPIPDRFNSLRRSTENKSGTWRDDEFEECIYEIIDLIERKYPKNLKMQKSIFVTAPTIFAYHLVSKEIKKHEHGEIPCYMRSGEHLVDLYEGMDVTKRALMNQMKEIMTYLEDCPKLRLEEITERLK